MRNKKTILLVEDDLVDAMTIKRALKELHVSNSLHVITDGEEALRFLTNPEFENPAIILLDLHMPKMDGIELLQIIKKDDVLKIIPVIILTTSDEEKHMITSYKLNVAGYMIKPVGYVQFVEIVKTIDLYWTLSHLPP